MTSAIPGIPACRLANAAILITIVATQFSCEPAPVENAYERDVPRLIALIGESESDAAWPVLQAAVARFKNDNPGFEVDLIAPPSPSPTGQQKLLDDLAKKTVSCVCIIPSDALSLRSAVKQLATGGRPVVTIGMDVPDSRRTVFSGPSELEIGQAAAAACALTLENRSPTVITLHAGDANAAYSVRRHAFAQNLPVHGSIQILKELDCSGNAFDAADLIRRESRNFPRVGCWVLFDDWPLRVTARDVRLLPLGSRMVVCGDSPEYLDRVRRGELQAMITFDFFEAVENALATARALIENPTAERPPFVMSKTLTITISELDWYERCWTNWRRGQRSPPEGP
ncbi:MAG TPA: substrate-binding domain-containing protein [Phycisphaerae bacterium]|nr:substrate-binding domain-containing protein [Phycisphaerae bacterium]